jgi:hypothetical protein
MHLQFVDDFLQLIRVRGPLLMCQLEQTLRELPVG